MCKSISCLQPLRRKWKILLPKMFIDFLLIFFYIIERSEPFCDLRQFVNCKIFEICGIKPISTIMTVYDVHMFIIMKRNRDGDVSAYGILSITYYYVLYVT